MSAVAFVLANWRWLLPLAICLGLAVDDGIHRIEAANCHAARAADKVAAERAKSDALAKAKESSDRIITEQAQALAATAAKVGGITERILHVPVTTACADSPAMRAATDGLRDLFARSRETEAGRNASPAVPRPGAGGR